MLESCDRALRRMVRCLEPRFVVGIGKFARTCADRALNGIGITVGEVTHPSPANPRANRGWEPQMNAALAEMGIRY